MASIPESALVTTFEMLADRLGKVEEKQEQLASSMERRALLQEQRTVINEDRVGEGLSMIFKDPIVGQHHVSSAEVSYYGGGDGLHEFPRTRCASVVFQWSGTPDYTAHPEYTALAGRARAVLQKHGLQRFKARRGRNHFDHTDFDRTDSSLSIHMLTDEKKCPLLWWDQWAALALDARGGEAPETVFVFLDDDGEDRPELHYFLTVTL